MLIRGLICLLISRKPYILNIFLLKGTWSLISWRSNSSKYFRNSHLVFQAIYSTDCLKQGANLLGYILKCKFLGGGLRYIKPLRRHQPSPSHRIIYILFTFQKALWLPSAKNIGKYHIINKWMCVHMCVHAYTKTHTRLRKSNQLN